VPPTKRDTHAGSQMDCRVGLQGGTLRNDKLKCACGHRRPGENSPPRAAIRRTVRRVGDDVDGMATDGRTK